MRASSVLLIGLLFSACTHYEPLPIDPQAAAMLDMAQPPTDGPLSMCQMIKQAANDLIAAAPQMCNGAGTSASSHCTALKVMQKGQLEQVWGCELVYAGPTIDFDALQKQWALNHCGQVLCPGGPPAQYHCNRTTGACEPI
jgi:hypothetical protein